METNLMSSFDWRRSTAVRIGVCVAAAVAVLVAVTSSRGGGDETTASPLAPSTTVAEREADPPTAPPETEDAEPPASSTRGSYREGSIMDQLAERFGFDRADGRTAPAGGEQETTGRAATAEDQQLTPGWVDARYRFSVLQPAGWSAVEGPVPDSLRLMSPDEEAGVVVAGATMTDAGLEGEIEFFRAEADGQFDDYTEDRAEPATFGGMDGYVITGTFTSGDGVGVFEVRWLVDGDSVWKVSVFVDAAAGDDALDDAVAVADSVTVARTS